MTAPDVVEDELSEWEGGELSHSFVVEDARVAGSLDDSRAADGRFARSLLAGVSLAGSRLRSLALTDVIARECNFANVDMTGGRLKRVVFERCRMTGATFSEVEAEHVVFRGCALDLVTFRLARVYRTAFEECRLVEADFYAAEIRFSAFSRCSLERADIDQLRLASVDLRGSELDALRGDLRALRGATIDSVQLAGLAPQFAEQLGIAVEED